MCVSATCRTIDVFSLETLQRVRCLHVAAKIAQLPPQRRFIDFVLDNPRHHMLFDINELQTVLFFEVFDSYTFVCTQEHSIQLYHKDKLQFVDPKIPSSAHLTNRDGVTLFCGYPSGELVKFTFLDEMQPTSAREHANEVSFVASFERNLICTCSADKTVIVWNAKLQVLHKLVGHHSPVTVCDVFCGVLFSGDSDGVIIIWDVKVS